MTDLLARYTYSPEILNLFSLIFRFDASGNLTVSFTSPGDDLDSDSPVSSYIIRVSDGEQEIEIGEGDLAGGASLIPVPGGAHKEIRIKYSWTGFIFTTIL